MLPIVCRLVIRREDVHKFSVCPNNALKWEAQEAYYKYLSTTVLGMDESCATPCTFSLLHPKTFFALASTRSIAMSLSDEIQIAANSTYIVTIRMPEKILLTESTFSYPFMNFASEFGGEILKGWSVNKMRKSWQ